jgi:hypothetical protein
MAGQPTLAQQELAAKNREFSEVLQMPILREIMEVFPGAELKAIKITDTE